MNVNWLIWRKPLKAISIEIDKELHEKLMGSAKKCCRSKTQEIALRLTDHIDRYEYILSVGHVIPRKENEHD